MRDSRRCDVVAKPQADSQSSLRLAQLMKVPDDADIDFISVDEPNNEILGSDETDTEFLYFDEPDDSANTSDGEENLQRDICLILQEHFGNVSKKWGNLGQWVLELQDGRRVAVLI